MSAEANKDLLRTAYAEMAKGNAQAFLGAMADDVTWTLIGTTKLSGTYRGKQDIIDNFFGPFMADIDGHAAITPKNFIADGDYVAMQAEGKARTRFGKDYDNTYCHVFRFGGGKIREVTEYCDTELVNEAFSA